MVRSKSRRNHQQVDRSREDRQNHDQATHGDVILAGNDIQMSAELATGVTSNVVVYYPEKKIAANNGDTHRASNPWRPFEIRYAWNRNPCKITYLLSGFECSFLNMRRVSFVEPLPSTHVCAICWVLPDKIMPLPCGHAVCLGCWYNAYDSADKPHQDNISLRMFRSGVCPKDDSPSPILTWRW
ncbi:hypothetical protein HPB49_019736 [Dermacentor silvarum]|uniref:Uncharacterized protein n=1 Tax=Dermacentor silvarum TaxID=543639 RepID=A0ACB8DR16_DERSI|nr:hypothetical protein HPB49_019736 [Dermacentor silvarum]